MKKLLSVLLLAGVVAGAGWFYLTPVFALDELRVAAEAGDTDRLRKLVDFPAVRQSIKDEARDAVAGELGGRTRSGALGSIGAFVAGTVVDRVVDVAVQPEGIAALTRGARPGEHATGEGGGGIDPDLRVRRGYESLDTFVVGFHDRETDSRRVALVLQRDGLADWKLSGIRIGDD